MKRAFFMHVHLAAVVLFQQDLLVYEIFLTFAAVFRNPITVGRLTPLAAIRKEYIVKSYKHNLL